MFIGWLCGFMDWAEGKMHESLVSPVTIVRCSEFKTTSPDLLDIFVGIWVKKLLLVVKCPE